MLAARPMDQPFSVPRASRVRALGIALPLWLAACASSHRAAPDEAPARDAGADMASVGADSAPPPHDGASPMPAPDLGPDQGLPADAPAAFQPCPPAGTPCRILPLGDSLTFGVGSSGAGGGYRVPLFRRAKQSITFVGSQANGPDTVDGVPFPRGHEGYRGYAIEPGGGRPGLSPIVDKLVQEARPHVVLLLAGTNDVGATVIDPDRAPDRLGALVDRVAAAAPEALIVVAQIPPSMTDAVNVRIQAFNQALPAVVDARVRAGHHLLLVDAYAALAAHADYKKALMFNEFHPNDAGYALIADRWYDAVGPFLR
jgi:lysophospholipase L1-like esterase